MLHLLTRCLVLITPFLWKDSKRMLISLATLLLTVMEIGIVVLPPFLFKHWASLLQAGNLSDACLLIIAYAASLAASRVLPKIRDIVFFNVINAASRDIRLQLVMHVHRTTLEQVAGYQMAELLGASTRVSQSLRGFMSTFFIFILPAFCKACVLAVAILTTVSHLWYLLLVVPLIYGYIHLLMRRYLSVHEQALQASDKVFVAMKESMQNTHFARFHPGLEEKRLSKVFDHEGTLWRENSLYQRYIPIAQALLASVAVGVTLVHLASLCHRKQITFADLLFAKTCLIAMYHVIHSITNHASAFMSFALDLRKVVDVLQLPLQKTLPPFELSKASASDKPLLELQDLCFHYPGRQQPMLDQVNLRIYPGDKIALVGPSGIGKSTLCHLLAGLYNPTRGQVLYKGVPMSQLTPEVLGKNLHFIKQEGCIVAGTMAENLSEEMSHAAVNSLGYLYPRLHEEVGEQGKALSTGEKQRILIARCLAYNPEIVILDETLSGLDSSAAHELLHMIMERIPTVVCTTHRESLLKNFDYVYKLQGGRLIPQPGSTPWVTRHQAAVATP